MKNVSLVITAAGSGSRVGLGFNKLLYRHCGEYLINITLSKFLDVAWINQILVTVSSEDYEKYQEIIPVSSKIELVIGGSLRSESVLNALSKVNECDYVIVHDGARPNVTSVMLDDLYSEILTGSECFAFGVSAIDTILEVENNIISKRLRREKLVSMQTPQVFEYKLCSELISYLGSGDLLTDEASGLFELGYSVKIIEGEYSNIKITTREDLDKIV